MDYFLQKKESRNVRIAHIQDFVKLFFFVTSKISLLSVNNSSLLHLEMEFVIFEVDLLRFFSWDSTLTHVYIPRSFIRYFFGYPEKNTQEANGK